jgi:hypothetical protein
MPQQSQREEERERTLTEKVKRSDKAPSGFSSAMRCEGRMCIFSGGSEDVHEKVGGRIKISTSRKCNDDSKRERERVL